MDVKATSIAGVLLFTPRPIPDQRGYFTRTFDWATAAEHGIDPAAFRQDSQSRSHRGVIRGLHLRVGQGEAKYVRCSSGAIFDVVVDLRPQSPTFLGQADFRLDDVTHQGIYIPAGCAHGWQALSEPADVCYRITREHDPSEDVTIRYDDPGLAIAWPDRQGFVAPKDLAGQSLTEFLAGITG